MFRRVPLILLASCLQTCMTYAIAVCTVKTPDDGQRNCPKHLEFYSKNKFEILEHLVGFIIRIYHDARSRERQNAPNNSYHSSLVRVRGHTRAHLRAGLSDEIRVVLYKIINYEWNIANTSQLMILLWCILTLLLSTTCFGSSYEPMAHN